jgi:predicted ester cyclase
MSAKEIKALARRAIKEWNKGKAAAMAAIDELYAPNFVSHGGGEEIRGIKNVKKSTSEEYKAFPDMHFTINDMIVEGDKLAARYTITGTHKGKYMGIAPTNKKVTVLAMAIDRIAGGKFVEEWGMYDALSFMQQLDLVPTPKKKK